MKKEKVLKALELAGEICIGIVLGFIGVCIFALLFWGLKDLGVILN